MPEQSHTDKRRPGRWWRLLRRVLLAFVVILAGLVGVILIGGWRAFFPSQISSDERLRNFPTEPVPVQGEVTVYWDRHQVPFIVAEHDGDAAFVLGMVHYHLRGGQMEVFKLASQGRISEMAGPIAAKVDMALQTLDFGYAVDSMKAALSTETRAWLEQFVAGVNFYKAHARRTHPGGSLLGISDEPYTLDDMLTLGRLAGTDVAWSAYFALLGLRDRETWSGIWHDALATGLDMTSSFKEQNSMKELQRLLTGMSRSGSNSVAISARKSRYGAAMLANDPHLGITVPNFWLLAGVKCPSYHCVGMMIPGLPFFALGRNPSLAWGGTNMRSASSDLYDVSSLPEDSFVVTEKTVRVRWLKDKKFTRRWSPYGPVITDVSVVPGHGRFDLALKWVGHEGSDDIGAFLRANRAHGIEEFVGAFRGYAVSGQNMLVVDTSGNIAMTIAARLPVRTYSRPDDIILDPRNPQHQWQGYVEAPEIPIAFNPSEGFIASANNKPTDNMPPIGFFFSGMERIDRLRELAGASDSIDFEYLRQMQQDVYSHASHRIAQLLVAEIDRLKIEPANSAYVTALREWDGHYRAESRGPVAFEALFGILVDSMMTETRSGFFFRTWNYLSLFFERDFTALPDSVRQSLLARAVPAAAAEYHRIGPWGEIHRTAAGWFIHRVPVVGGLFRYDEWGTSGSRETVMKTDHELGTRRYITPYGSQSRHISIMDDPDHNYFVLFGGNDGWLGSDNLLDMVPLWKGAEYIQLPLRVEHVHTQSRYRMQLSPSQPIRLESTGHE